MKQMTSTLLVLLLLAACTGNETKAPAATRNEPPPAAEALPHRDTTFRPGFFASFPDTLNGCSSYFTYDTLKVETGNYIFLTNYRDLALIRVDGKDVYLHKDRKESKPPSDDESRDVYRGEGYTVILGTKRIRSVDEVSYYTGTLEIAGNGIQVQYPVHGEGGC